MNTIERNTRYDVIESKDASYTIRYGSHRMEDTELDITSADMLALESWMYSFIDQPEDTSETILNHKQYRKVTAEALSSDIPIYLIDLEYSQLRIIIDMLKSSGLAAATSAITLKLLKDAIQDNPKISRRQFLKLSTGGMISGITVLNSGLIRGIGFYSDNALLSKLSILSTEGARGIIRSAVPAFAEPYTLDSRNLIMALKLVCLGRSFLDSNNRRPDLTTIIGANHTEISKYLSRPLSELIAIANSKKTQIIDTLIPPAPIRDKATFDTGNMTSLWSSLEIKRQYSRNKLSLIEFMPIKEIFDT